MEVNLLGDGWAYAIVCEPTGFMSMDFAFPLFDLVRCCSLQTNTEMIEWEFLLFVDFSVVKVPNAVHSEQDRWSKHRLYCSGLVSS